MTRTSRSRHPWRFAAPDWMPRMEPVDWLLLGALAALVSACACAFAGLVSLMGVAPCS